MPSSSNEHDPGRSPEQTAGQVDSAEVESAAMPGDNLDISKMPGHWVLARVGKRVLRPGGIALTRKMLAALRITPDDHVVEFAPGLGLTAKLALKSNPASYTAVERDAAAAGRVARRIAGSGGRVVRGSAEASGLEDGAATAVYGEAMLTMQSLERKRKIIQEAARILAPGGRYAVHEICLVPDDIAPETVEQIDRELAEAIRSRVRPLLRAEWRAMFDEAGLDLVEEATGGFLLLEPSRILRDEGLLGAARIALNLLRDRGARRRTLEMRRAIRRHAHNMQAIMLLGVKR